MPDRPLVSIGVPVRNGERFIARALESHLCQTYHNIEILISNNASTDSTREIVNAYAARDVRVRVYNQAEALGAVANFMSVLDAAQGEYFMWAADDDSWLPEFVETLIVELQNHPDAGVAMSAVDLVKEDGQLIQTIRFCGRYNPNTSSYLHMLRGATSFEKLNYYIYGMYRTSLLKRATAKFADVPGSDRLFVCHLSLGVRFRYVDRVLHLRTMQQLPTHVRLPEERFNTMKREPWVDLRVLAALASSVSRSEIVPWWRKLYLPYALFRYARLLATIRAGIFAKRHLPAVLWSRLLRSRAGDGSVNEHQSR